MDQYSLAVVYIIIQIKFLLKYVKFVIKNLLLMLIIDYIVMIVVQNKKNMEINIRELKQELLNIS